MKMSDIAVTDVAEFLRLETGEYVDKFLETILTASKSYVLEYTNLTVEEADAKEDLWIAIMVLCQDMNDNRSMYIDKNNVNRVVSSILDMHRKNLIG